MERVSRFRRNDACFIQSLDVDMESNTGMKKAAIWRKKKKEKRKKKKKKASSWDLQNSHGKERKKKRGSRVCVTLWPGCDLFSVK